MDKINKNKQMWFEIISECVKILRSKNEALLSIVKHNEKTRKNVALFLLVRRIITNIRAIEELAGASYKNNGSLLFKFSVGLLLRNCLTDGITGLYLMKQDDKVAAQILDLLNHDYAKALLEEYEVYRDKIRDLNYDDVFVEHLYTMAVEDKFIEHYNYNEDYKEIIPLQERKMWKARPTKKYLPEGSNVDPQMKKMWKFLSQDPQLASCANSLFAYYKYFSQWEHFSENGSGDAFANFGEDNIKMSMTFCHISTALNEMLNLLSPSTINDPLER